MKKGQAAIELLILLSVALIALIAIYGYSADSMNELNKQKIINELQTSANDLANAADEVYAQGIGAKKKVFYRLPTDVNRNASGIEGKSFVFQSLGNDVIARAQVSLSGSIPLGKGGHEVWLTAYENYVFVGTENIAVDKTSSYVTLPKSDAATDTITITNNGESSADFTLSSGWAHTNVTLGINPGTFTLAADAVQTVVLTYTSNASATGNYADSLSISADFGATTETISIPVDAEVIVSTVNLVALPGSWTTTISQGGSENKDFNICNISAGTLSNVTFTASSGEPGKYMDAVTAITSLPAETCIEKTITLDTAISTIANHTGSITVQDGSGSGTNADAIALDVTITS